LRGVRAVSTPFLVSIYCWFAFEVGLVVSDLARRRARPSRDRGTRAILALSLGGSIFIGSLLPRWVPALDTPAPDAFATAGLVVIWAGLAAWLGGTDARRVVQHVRPGRRRPGRHHPRPVPVGTAPLLHRPATDRPGIRPPRA
jgi:hypothetical protein